MRFQVLLSKSSKNFAWRLCPHRYQNELYKTLIFLVNKLFIPNCIYETIFSCSTVSATRVAQKILQKANDS